MGEVTDAGEHDGAWLSEWIGHVVFAGSPVRRVDHRRHVVDMRREQPDVLGDLIGSGGGDAEHRHTEERISTAELGVGIGDEAGHDDVRGDLQPGKVHRRCVALGTAHVVVEDLVEAQLGGFHGEVDQVLTDLGAGEVGERRGSVVGGQRSARTLQHDHV